MGLLYKASVIGAPAAASARAASFACTGSWSRGALACHLPPGSAVR